MLDALPPLWVVPAAFAVSFVGSLGGLSGAFLLLPFQMSVLGIAGPVATSTNHFFNALAIPGGLSGLWRRGRVLRPLALVAVCGTVPGVVLGAYVRAHWLADPASFLIFTSLLMAGMGGMLLGRAADRRRREPAPDPLHPPAFDALGSTLRILRLHVGDHVVTIPTSRLFIFSLAVGVVGGTYGIGGGAILAPFLLTSFDLPVHATSGATLLATFVTSVVAVVSYAVLGRCLGVPGVEPDWLLGGFLGLGGMAGIWCGCRVQVRLRSSWIEALLGVVLVGLSARYLSEGLAALGV